jgi:hypothetical protein
LFAAGFDGATGFEDATGLEGVTAFDGAADFACATGAAGARLGILMAAPQAAHLARFPAISSRTWYFFPHRHTTEMDMVRDSEERLTTRLA